MFSDIYYCKFTINGELSGVAIVTEHNPDRAKYALSQNLDDLGYGEPDEIKVYEVNPSVCDVQFVSFNDL